MNSIKCFSLYFFLFIVLSISAQESVIKDKFSIKLGYNAANSDVVSEEFNGTIIKRYDRKPHIQLEFDYRFSKGVDLGLYIGYSNLEHIEPIYNNGQPTHLYNIKPTNTIYYGLNLNYHLLPLFIHQRTSRFDIYATGKLGLVSESWKDNLGNTIHPTAFLECSAGLGAGYNFTKQFGVFTEYTIGTLYNEQVTLLRGGLFFKF